MLPIKRREKLNHSTHYLKINEKGGYARTNLRDDKTNGSSLTFKKYLKKSKIKKFQKIIGFVFQKQNITLGDKKPTTLK